MIKDILVNASVTSSHDVAIDFAVSIATAFEAHIVATAFVYDPVPTVATMGSLPAALVERLRADREQIAKEALATGRGVYDLVLEHKLMTRDDLDRMLNPRTMLGIG